MKSRSTKEVKWRNHVPRSVAGVEIVGPLPGDLQDNIVFAAAIMGSSKNVQVGKALLDFLRTPEAAAVMKANGMEPGNP